MSIATTNLSSCTDSSTFLSRLKWLLPTGSQRSQQITSKLANAAAIGLVAASAGFGAVYAFTTGSQHGIALACLMVLMAVALEIAKPLSLAAAFNAFRSWSIVRGAALAILATVAIGYSLTGELSLMATSRGDTIATREASIKAASDVEAEALRARDRYDRAKAELDTLPVARPATELQAEIDGLLLTPGADGCAAINGKVTRDVCPKVATLRAEKARAERRAELEQIVATPLAQPHSPQTSASHAVSKSDPAASALSTYLAFFGIAVAPSVLSEWLVLVGVLALEVGSAMAGVLAQSFAGSAGAVQPFASRKRESEPASVQPPVAQVVHARPIEVSEPVDHTREKVKRAIVQQLKTSGGSVSGGERGLAKLIGANRSTMKRAINGLVMAGIVVAEATRNGTMLRLVG